MSNIKVNCPLCQKLRLIVSSSRMVCHGAPGQQTHSYPAVYVFECKSCNLTIKQNGVCGNDDVLSNQRALNKLVAKFKKK